MGLNDLKLKVGTKLAELAAKDFAKKAENGDLGARVQAAYIKTKGYKSAFSLALFLIVQALGQFAPPDFDSYIRYASIVSGALFALGILDRARRNEPIWDKWFLEALASASAWIGAVSTAVLGVVQSGLFDLIAPGDLAQVDLITLICTALTTATAFINRLAKASASEPK